MLATKPPRIRRTANNTQLTYNLPSRVHEVKAYPVLSPQGATILIYGHDNGVTIVWRGGRRFKTAKPTSSLPNKPNGNADDSVMIIDSDGEAPATKKDLNATSDAPEFEDEDDDDVPYLEVVQTLELASGTPVLHISLLPMAPCKAEDGAWGGASILKSTMVFAISYATRDVYVVMLPLTPPSSERKVQPELRRDISRGRLGSGFWGETMVHLEGQTMQTHGLAIAMVKPKASSTAGRIKDNAGDVLSTPKPRVVVASHTHEASGVLRFWDVVLEPKISPADRTVSPFQTEHLTGYISDISFNPTHMSQLLAVFPQQAVRIYDYALPSIPPSDLSTGPFPSQGSWILSLHQPFARPAGSRKPILDAAWIAHGKAILALLADGMWGVWDIDGASPPGPTLLGRQSPGIRGAAITSFSASGYVEGTGSLRAIGVSSQKHQTSHPGEFVPMTPHTRKDAAASFASNASAERLSAIRGGISVVSLPTTRASADESAVLWVGSLDHVCVIPAISRFWDAQIRKGAGGGVNLFSGAQPTRMVRLHDLSTGLLGERCCGVEALVSFSKQKDGSAGDGGLPVDVLIRGETRIVIVKDAEGNTGFKLGDDRRRGLRDKLTARLASNAIVVHSNGDRKKFNLSVSKPGMLRLNKASLYREDDADSPMGDDDSEIDSPSKTKGEASRAGFAFASTLNAAADAMEETRRDIEVEMLDIMGLDKKLNEMEENRGSGRKRVLFDEN